MCRSERAWLPGLGRGATTTLAAGAEVLSTVAVGRPPLLPCCLLRLPTRETDSGWDSTREGPRGRRLSTLPQLGRGLAAPLPFVESQGLLRKGG